MDRLAVRTTVSHLRYHGSELRVVRVERPPERIVAFASDVCYEIGADLEGAVFLAAAWALAKRSPRSLVHLPIRANQPPTDVGAPAMDLVFLHASAQFRASDWKSVRARSRAGAAHRIELGTLQQEFPARNEIDLRPTTYPDYPHHLRYAAAAGTVFVVGSGPAFEREGAFLRWFIERFDHVWDEDPHHCIELWQTRRSTKIHKRRIRPDGLHVYRETEDWPATGTKRPSGPGQ
jgi:hypothetical protein